MHDELVSDILTYPLPLGRAITVCMRHSTLSVRWVDDVVGFSDRCVTVCLVICLTSVDSLTD